MDKETAYFKFVQSHREEFNAFMERQKDQPSSESPQRGAPESDKASWSPAASEGEDLSC